MSEENEFKNILASLQARRGWTQEDAVAHIIKDEVTLKSISLRTYSDWITGKRLPSQKQLKLIAAAFKLSQADEAELYLAAAHSAPKIHNLPFRRNPLFTGRATYLEQLDTHFKTGDSVALTQSLSISGLGGIGKTQLALEYAYRCFLNVYQAVFWVDAADISSLQASYVELARLLELPERSEQELYLIVQAVKDWLERHTNWLLIMDNADDLELASSFFPKAHQGRILLTTRSQIVGNVVANQIEIAEMTPEEGLLFLLRRSRVLQDDADLRAAADQLVELLGGHPLALDQAGAYIQETGESFTEYINLYQKQRRDLLNRRKSQVSEYSEHPESVVVTFELCFELAHKRHPLATAILRFCAFLHPDAIPMELFQHDDSLKHDTNAFREGIIALRRYSLIKRNLQDKTCSIHRLVQAVLIDDISSDLQMQWRRRVVDAVNASFPEPEHTNWRQCERLLSHALFCATWTEDELTPTLGLANLLYKAGAYLRAQGLYSDAETLLARVPPIYEQHLGAAHLDTANALNDLALLYTDLGTYSYAEHLYKQSLAIKVKLVGFKHPTTARSLSNLSALYLKQGKYKQAELIDLALLYFYQGEYAQADLLYQQALYLGAEAVATEMNDEPNQ